ncbi:MAG: hypothetical protein PHN72_05985 [Bacilli bacterium]|nr:hypothetical protein [Bacilli bacterium]
MIFNKQNTKVLVISFLFLLSLLLVFYKVLGLKTITCTMRQQDTTYTREETILIKYKQKQVQKMVFKETFFTSIPDILELKKTEYEEKEYIVTKGKQKLKAQKKENVKIKYKETIDTLLKEGYTCK